jgi:hypothetical protein
MVYSIIIGVIVARYEWVVNYKGNIIRIVNTATKTELWINEKRVDEVYKLIAFGVKLTSKLEEETVIVNTPTT